MKTYKLSNNLTFNKHIIMADHYEINTTTCAVSFYVTCQGGYRRIAVFASDFWDMLGEV